MVALPDLKNYMNKKVSVQLNGSRKVIGTLRGYDVFLNLTLDEALEEQQNGDKLSIGTIGEFYCIYGSIREIVSKASAKSKYEDYAGPSF